MLQQLLKQVVWQDNANFVDANVSGLQLLVIAREKLNQTYDLPSLASQWVSALSALF